MTQVHVVTHTHWDREWYLSFEVFRVRLIELMEKLLQIMEKDPDYHFHLDGQTVVLEDYQEVGGNMEKLIKLVRQGNIQVGPWYILPDEFLITGEAWIRNYLYSQKIAKRFGIPLSKVAYLPDMFGHNAYMPTILKGLGMEWSVLWRGVGREDLLTFLWKSPHGDAVNVYHLVDGYGNASHQDKTEEEFKERLLEEAKRLEKLQGDSVILLMNGTDHELPLANIKDILKELSSEELHFFQSDLETFLSELEKPEKEILGELRNPKKEPVLKNVTSTRTSGKRLHFEADQLYEHYVEPLLALAKMNGEEISSEELWYGWKLILQSQPHDSICGCGADEVHRTVLDRLRRAIDHGKMLCAKAAKRLVTRIHSEKGLLVFNPLEWESETLVETIVYLPRGNWQLEEADFSVILPVEDSDSNQKGLEDPLALRFLSEHSVDTVVPPDSVPHRCYFKAKLPPLGLKSFKIVPRKTLEDETKFATPFEIAENGTLKVCWEGFKYENLCYVKDIEDAGDEYNFSPVCEQAYTSVSISTHVESVLHTPWIKRDRVNFTLKLPKSLTPDRKRRSRELVRMPVTVEYSFYKDTPTVDVRVELENNVKDHMLTMVFPLGEIKELYTDGYFGLVKQKVKNYKEDYTNWVELPENTFALWSVVTVPDKRITLVTRGIHEVHVTKAGLELTLLRGVEWLSRDDLKTRKGHAGPALRTPEAQELGKHRFELSLILHKKWDPEEVYKEARKALLRPKIWQANCEVKKIKVPFKIHRGILSAFKPAEGQRDVILRVFNPTGREPEVDIFDNAEKVDLAERPQKEGENPSLRTWKISRQSAPFANK